MKLDLHTQFPAQLQNQWDELLEQSTANVPFLRFDFLRRWWQTRGGGEWPQGELKILTAQNENGQLSAVAPLFKTLRDGEPCILFVGSHEVFDYLDFIARPEDLAEFIESVLTALKENEPDCKTLDLYNLIDDSPSIPALQAAAAKTGWRLNLEQIQPCPYIPLEGDWETYLTGINKKQRHEIRRKMRRFEELEGTRWYIVEDAQSLPAEMESFLGMMGQDNEKHVFLTPEMRVFMQDIARTAMDAGILQLSFVEIDGQKAAGKLIFQHQGKLLAYNSAVDDRFREHSPGWVLLGFLLQWATEHGMREFDFMRGNEEYKYRFGAKDRFVMRATLTHE
jgi:CelD/BcsL family acetyltransferase involved in cellulose biosynthesis